MYTLICNQIVCDRNENFFQFDLINEFNLNNAKQIILAL